MKQILMLLIAVLFCCGFINAQPDPQTLWSRVFVLSDQNDIGLAICSAGNGGSVMAGVTGLSNNDAIANGVLIRLNSNGDTLWVRHFPGSPWRTFEGIQRTSDGGFIVAGSANIDSANIDALLMKTDSVGQAQWTHYYGYPEGVERFTSVRILPDGSFICAGVTSSLGDANGDFYLVNTNSSGDTIWTSTHSTTFGDIANSVELCSDGGFILAGNTTSNNGDILIAKTNNLGEAEWISIYGGDLEDYTYGALETSDAGFFIAGISNSFDASERYRHYLIRTNRSGDTLWTASPGNQGQYIVDDLQGAEGGGYLLTGTYYGNTGGFGDAYLMKVDSMGNSLWSRRYLSNNMYYESGSALCKTSDECYMIAGTQVSNTSTLIQSIFVVKTGPDAISATDPANTALLPQNYALEAYPNPFNPTTTLALTIPVAGNVTLAIYDVLGRQTQTIADHEFYAAGIYEFVWNASSLPSGVYIARLTCSELSLAKKLLLLK